MTENADVTEIAVLRRTTRDIVALSSLLSSWVQHSPSQIAESLAETLAISLDLELAYVQIAGSETRIETAYTRKGFLTKNLLDNLSEQLRPIIEAKVLSLSLPDFFCSEIIQLHLSSIGSDFKGGILVVGSNRKNFPMETERLVLNVATNQANATILHKWAHERAEESEERLGLAHSLAEREQLLFENNPLPMWIFDPHTLNFLDVNGTAILDYGYSKEEFLSMKLTDIRPKEDIEKFRQALKKTFTSHRRYNRASFRHLKKDGTIIHVEVSTHDLDLNGRRVRMAAVIDVSRKVEIESKQQELMDSLKIAKDEAEHANELKSSFLANMSHEIRTPLGIMIGFTDLILEPNLSVDDRNQYASVVKRNGEQLSVIINDILDLSKVEAGFLKVDLNEFSLRNLVEEVLSTFSAKAAGKGLSLEFQEDANAKDQIISDSVRLKQILLNLISNSVKFTHAGYVKLSVQTEKDKIHFEVSDSGIGIPIHEQEKLFKPFTQVDASSTRKFGGTGLGLALSKKLAHLLGGDLELKISMVDRGSTFSLSIANHLSFADRSEKKSFQCTVAAHTPEVNGLQNLQILLVEDSPDNQYLILRALSKKGAIIDVAENGIIGVEKALKRNYDIVLMDIQMPVMDGYTATQKLREQGYCKPILALTAHAMSEARKKCLEVGYTDYLTKPIDFNDLIMKIEKYSRSE